MTKYYWILQNKFHEIILYVSMFQEFLLKNRRESVNTASEISLSRLDGPELFKFECDCNGKYFTIGLIHF